MEKDDAPDSMDVDAVEHDLSHSVQKIHISPQKDQQRKRKRSIWEDEIDQDREEGLIGTADEDTDEAPSATLALASSSSDGKKARHYTGSNLNASPAWHTPSPDQGSPALPFGGFPSHAANVNQNNQNNFSFGSSFRFSEPTLASRTPLSANIETIKKNLNSPSWQGPLAHWPSPHAASMRIGDNVLEAGAPEDLGFEILVKTLNGRKVIVRVSGKESIADLKLTIYSKTGIPASEQRLIYKGKHMADEYSLSHYGLEHGSLVHLVFALKGGVVGPASIFLTSPSSFRPATSFSSSSFFAARISSETAAHISA